MNINKDYTKFDGCGTLAVSPSKEGVLLSLDNDSEAIGFSIWLTPSEWCEMVDKVSVCIKNGV